MTCVGAQFFRLIDVRGDGGFAVLALLSSACRGRAEPGEHRAD